jgi:ketosteroid isomerase-like protein
VVHEEPTVDALAQRVRLALESADPAQFAELLAPDVRWGAPDDPAPSCQNRSQVLAWYERGRAAGMRARVVDVHVRGDKIVVGLRVARPSASGEADSEGERWQVLTCRDGLVADIRAFDDRNEAFARADLDA